MAKKIKLELTEKEFDALISMIDNCSSAFCEIPDTMNEVKKCDNMLKKNGYKRMYK